jgi:hypothetical protein
MFMLENVMVVVTLVVMKRIWAFSFSSGFDHQSSKRIPEGKEKVQDVDQTLGRNDVTTIVALITPNARIKDDNSFWESIKFKSIDKIIREHVFVSASCFATSFATIDLTVSIVVVWPLGLSIVGLALAPIANTFNIGSIVLNLNLFDIN